MFEVLIYATLLVCVSAMLLAFVKYQDVFHPLIFVPPMCIFIYVYMPLNFIRTGELSTFLTDEQCRFVQAVVLAAVGAWIWGCFTGSDHPMTGVRRSTRLVDARVLHKGAYILGGIGMLFWVATVRASGGLTRAFGSGYGMVWSPVGWVRESIYLLIIAVLLLLSPEAFRFPRFKWTAAVFVFSVPWIIQALLGARRGPTFIITVAIGMSWFIARGPVHLLC